MLQRICADKRDHIARRKAELPEADLRQRAAEQSPPRGFHARLKEKAEHRETALICEIKKASPSKGLIRAEADFDPEHLAVAYAEGGATCLSVLTDIPYFQGDDAYLPSARNACALPVLRKDFMLDPYQVTEARALGADCILLIMAALSDGQAAELEAAALAFGMDVLVEVHDETELERALGRLSSRLLGVNNRNLRTLVVDLAVSERLGPRIPAEYTKICESGIAAPGDIARMRESGYYCFLVGESLMRWPDVKLATGTLLSA